MSWKQFAFLTLALVALNAVRYLVSEPAEWLALLGASLLGYFAVLVARRRWRRRAERLRQMRPDEADAVLDTLPPDEGAALRLALGRARSADEAAGADGQEFRYPRTPALIREATFWGSVAIALLAYATLLAGWDAEERWYAVALGLGFTASVGYQRVAWDRELTTIRVSPKGIEQRSADGTVSAVPWHRVAMLRNRPVLMCVDIHSADGRRLRVGYNLVGFPRFLELAVAHFK